MKTNCVNQLARLNSSPRWIVSSKFLIPSQLFTVILVFFVSVFAATAQDMNTRPAETSRTVKSSDNSAATAVSELQLNADRPAELAVFEAKINNLLSEVRKQLAVASNKEWFRQNLEKSIRDKSEQVCPTIRLLDLMYGDAVFVCAPIQDKQELLCAITFLNLSINGILTK